jgi:hypothetical protein
MWWELDVLYINTTAIQNVLPLHEHTTYSDIKLRP